MIPVELTSKEILQFQFVLPVQGSIETLEMVEQITKKAKIDNKDMKGLKKIDFDQKEIDFIKNMINILDEQNLLHFESLSFIRKFLNIKGA
jgi:hypothetical protein